MRTPIYYRTTSIEGQELEPSMKSNKPPASKAFFSCLVQMKKLSESKVTLTKLVIWDMRKETSGEIWEDAATSWEEEEEAEGEVMADM